MGSVRHHFYQKRRASASRRHRERGTRNEERGTGTLEPDARFSQRRYYSVVKKQSESTPRVRVEDRSAAADRERQAQGAYRRATEEDLRVQPQGPALPGGGSDHRSLSETSVRTAAIVHRAVEVYGLPPSAFETAVIARWAFTLLPASSRGGATTAMPNLPGETAMSPPPTPLFAGRPV